jgi:hypothetical protein
VDDLAVDELVDTPEDGERRDTRELRRGIGATGVDQVGELADSRVAAGDRARTRGEHLDDAEPRRRRVLGDEVDKRREPLLDAVDPRLLRSRLVRLGGCREHASEPELVGGEEAVLLVAEQLVEGLARDAGVSDHARDLALGVAAFRGDLDHRRQDAAALRFGNHLPGEPVSPARKLLQSLRVRIGLAHRGTP